MWFALGAGVLGSFSVSALTYRKIFLHDLVHSGLAVTYLLNLGWYSLQFMQCSS